MLDSARKLYKRLLLQRLCKHLECIGGLATNQFGFRASMSTMDAIVMVMREADLAARGVVQDHHLCALVTLDVGNVFNSTTWNLIDSALPRRITPTCIKQALRSYFSERTLKSTKRIPLPSGL